MDEERRLESKIQYFEDMLLRCKQSEYQKAEILSQELRKMRIRLAKMKMNRTWGGA